MTGVFTIDFYRPLQPAMSSRPGREMHQPARLPPPAPCLRPFNRFTASATISTLRSLPVSINGGVPFTRWMKRGFQPNATNLRIYESTLAPANRNRAVLFPAKLKFLRFKKNDSPNFSTFLLVVVQLMVQIKFNFNNFARVCHSLAECQRHTRRRRWWL